MDITTIVAFIGWVFAITPVVIFLVVSIYMIMGAMGDDQIIRVLVLSGLTMFFMGVVMLILLYLTDVFQTHAVTGTEAPVLEEVISTQEVK